ncbi:cell division protein ZapA [Pigmentiphaga sp. NML080357]|uniref:cell division protein ZapA n=1 Tax=Pigmentiphaga sp. NML080357 TaxID=2008675 RepID=UPI000B4159C6|nr:cell division protein ZapA [Pigmentiphaga sp. NML080357]OVZ61215.1 cell division protein ZapA [Pigmentiphaga sp. NML080357]
MERLDVTILGKEYPLACEPSEKEALLTAANMVDRTMQRIKASGKVAGTERIAVMAALQLAGELMNAKSPDARLAVGDYKRKIEDMHRMVDAALGTQEKLF